MQWRAQRIECNLARQSLAGFPLSREPSTWPVPGWSPGWLSTESPRQPSSLPYCPARRRTLPAAALKRRRTTLQRARGSPPARHGPCPGATSAGDGEPCHAGHALPRAATIEPQPPRRQPKPIDPPRPCGARFPAARGAERHRAAAPTRRTLRVGAKSRCARGPASPSRSVGAAMQPRPRPPPAPRDWSPMPGSHGGRRRSAGGTLRPRRAETTRTNGPHPPPDPAAC